MRPLIFLIALLLPVSLIAQTNNTLQNAEKGLNNIKQLFGKKKAGKDSTAATTTPFATTTGSTSGNPNGSPAGRGPGGEHDDADPGFPLGAHMHVIGKLLPSAKVIDCDEMSPFDHGVCIIRKGTAYALIDANANVVVPWNRYLSIKRLGSPYLPGGGIFKAEDPTLHGNFFYINYRGQVLHDYMRQHDEYGYLWEESNGGFLLLEKTADMKNISHWPESTAEMPSLVIGADGKKHYITHPASGGCKLISDSLIIFTKAFVSGNVKKELFGAKDLNNRTILKPSVDFLTGFSHGIAIFGNTDQFGVMQYGIINKNGRIILPASVPFDIAFKREQGSDFVDIPQTATSNRSILNLQSGKIIFKEAPQQDKNKATTFGIDGSPDFCTGSLNGESAIMDSAGNIQLTRDLLDHLGIKIPNKKYKSVGAMVSGGPENAPYFRLSLIPVVYSMENTIVLYSPGNEDLLIIPTGRGYSDYRDGPFFDPFSQLAMTSVPTGLKDNLGQPIVNQGFINRRGEMVLVKANVALQPNVQ